MPVPVWDRDSGELQAVLWIDTSTLPGNEAGAAALGTRWSRRDGSLSGSLSARVEPRYGLLCGNIDEGKASAGSLDDQCLVTQLARPTALQDGQLTAQAGTRIGRSEWTGFSAIRRSATDSLLPGTSLSLATPELAPLAGLQLALDIATGDAVRAGRIVVVEDHWFRRTLQTVLGLKLDREHDPLLGGSFISGNSKVGRTLFLSEEGTEKKFLALFDASIRLKSADQATVDAFFASLAHRVTVIVHETAADDEFALIERVCAAETPAHVVTRVRRASADFMVGLTALLAVDTYLRPHPVPAAVAVGTTTLGDGALLQRPASLDPRLEGGAS